jgi:hypothetical protein
MASKDGYPVTNMQSATSWTPDQVVQALREALDIPQVNRKAALMANQIVHRNTKMMKSLPMYHIAA